MQLPALAYQIRLWKSIRYSRLTFSDRTFLCVCMCIYPEINPLLTYHCYLLKNYRTHGAAVSFNNYQAQYKITQRASMEELPKSDCPV